MNNKEKSIDGFQKKMLEIPIALSSVELPDFFHFIDNARFAIMGSLSMPIRRLENPGSFPLSLWDAAFMT